MRVLIACGRGMKAISTEMDRRFKNGTIKFDYVKKMEEVNNVLASQLGIERVIITSESFTDGRVVVEEELREQLIRLSNTLADYNTSVVFVISSDEMGPVIEEELFNYGDRVRIVKHSASYTVKLFERLTLTDISKIENSYESNSLTSIEDVSTVEVEESSGDIFEQIDNSLDDYFNLDSEEDEEEDYFDLDGEDEEEEYNYEEQENSSGIAFEQISDYGNIYTPSFESSAAPLINQDSEYETIEEELEDIEKLDENREEIEPIPIEEEDEFNSMTDEIDMDSEEVVGKFEGDVQDEVQEEIEETQEEVQEEVREEVQEEVREEVREYFKEFIETQNEVLDTQENTNVSSDILGVFNENMYSTIEDTEESVEKQTENNETQVVNKEAEKVVEQTKKVGFLSKLFGKKDKNKVTELPVVKPDKSDEENNGPRVRYEDEYSHTHKDLVSSLDGNTDFNDSMYSSNNGTDLDIREAMTQKELDEITELLGKLSNRHANYVFTGTRCSGATSIAYNVSAILSNLGFSVLYVDCDTEYRPLSYITKDLFNMVHVNEETSASYLKAVGSPINIENYVHIVMPGLHTITMGLEQDTTHINKIVDKQKFRRFSGMVRDRYDFVIYDMPFEFLISTGLETAFVSDNIVTVVEANTKGLMELLVKFGNIENEDARMLLFSKASILMNKYSKNTLYFGKRFKKQESLLEQLDNIGEEITGAEADFRFVNMKCLGVFPYVEGMDNCWFTNDIAVADKTINQHMLNIIKAMVGGE